MRDSRVKNKKLTNKSSKVILESFVASLKPEEKHQVLELLEKRYS